MCPIMCAIMCGCRSRYVPLAAAVLAHARQHLSTVAMAAHALAAMNASEDVLLSAAAPLLFVARRASRAAACCRCTHRLCRVAIPPRPSCNVRRPQGHCSEDFTSDSLLHGLQQLLGATVEPTARDIVMSSISWCTVYAPWAHGDEH